MSNTSTGTGNQRAISGRGQLLLAGLLATLVAATALTLYVVATQPVVTLATANAAPRVAAIQHQEALKDQRLEQNSATGSNRAIAPVGDGTLGADWMADLAGRIDAVAGQQRQEKLKDQWLERRAGSVPSAVSDNVSDPLDVLKEKLMIEHGLIGAPGIHSVQLQEELKDRWLEQRGSAGAVDKSAADDCNLECVYISQQLKRDMCEESCDW